MCIAKTIWKCFSALFFFLLLQYGAGAQGCPVNIGFEKGGFTKWETLAGGMTPNGVNLFPTNQPLPGVHTLYKKSQMEIKDPFGDFPVNCPNGSGYSVQLGNGSGGNGAEALHYTFNIPADRNDFNLVYYYAVVIQNGGHPSNEQPKFTVKTFNVSTGKYITCSSFEYVAKAGLPGFQVSSKLSNVLYKNWTPVTINLSRYAGATIRLEFTTNDCAQIAHFGYAYIDVDENCYSPISGTTVCPGDAVSDLTAPKGFESYKWFNGDFSKLLGTQNTLQLPGMPAGNTVFALELTPMKDQGCIDTVYGRIRYSTEAIDLRVTQTIVEDCINNGVDITKDLVTTGSPPGLSYSYYTDSLLKEKYFLPDSVIASGTYYIKATNADGCFVSKPLTVKVNPAPVFTVTADPKPVIKPATFDLTKVVLSGSALSYWNDKAAIIPVINPGSVDKGATYYIKITTLAGCVAITSVTVSFIDPSIGFPNIFSPNGDGINDTWEMPSLKYYPECIVEIFSRSGQQLFRNIGYTKPWDGKYGGEYLPLGTYYYVIRLTQTSLPISGSVTIIR
jgi:gliding motility-associated-like protein